MFNYRCEHCGKDVHAVHRVRISGSAYCERWCADCLGAIETHRCEVCGDHVRPADLMPNDEFLCRVCYNRGYRRCTRCGRVSSKYDDKGLCDTCSWFDPSAIHDYDYWPEDGLVKHATGAEEHPGLYLGFELEVDCNQYSSLQGSVEWLAATVQEDGVAWCKSDGSLRCGFEMVSHPATLEWHKSFPWQVKLDFLRAHGLQSYDVGSCGLHVHIDRKFNTEGQWRELSDWINTNQFFVAAISRRNSSYARYYDDIDLDDVYDYTGDEIDSEEVRRYVLDGKYRYAALNFCNGGTVELRTPRGTLNYQRFLATLEFADALSVSFNRGVPTLSQFVDGVKNGGQRWAELAELIKQKGY